MSITDSLRYYFSKEHLEKRDKGDVCVRQGIK